MKYSIITINYNNREGLRRTIESVVNQTFRDFEYIIIDGGSTDGSVEVIKEYAERIDYWVSEPDKGIYNAMNKGILQAHGEYLNFMNSGDCFYDDNVLNKMLEFVFLGDDIIIGCSVAKNNSEIVFKPRKPMTLMNLCLYGFNHQATFYKKNLFSNNLYDEDLKLLSDWKFTVYNLIIKSCSYRYIDIFIASYDTTGQSSVNKSLMYQEKDEIIRSLFPKYLAEDYIFISKLRSPVIYDIPEIAETYRLHKLVIKLIRILLIIHRKLLK